MSQALRKLTGNIKRSNTLVIFINQIRMKIGVMFGNPETTTGGNALKFYASVRLDIRRIGAIKKGEEVIGNETRVKVVKNKVAPPFRERRVRHPLRRRHLARRRDHRPRRAARHHREVRRLVQLQGRPDRPGQGQRARVPARATRTSRPRSRSRSARAAAGQGPGASRRGGGCGAPSLTSSDPGACERAALDLLARREHSRRELERKLGARGFADELIAPTLDGLEESGELASARFTASFIRARAGKGQGPARIRAELAERGIDREQAAEHFRAAAIDWAADRDLRPGQALRRRPPERLQRARSPSAVPRVPGLRPRPDRPRARLRGRPRLRPTSTCEPGGTTKRSTARTSEPFADDRHPHQLRPRSIFV